MQQMTNMLLSNAELGASKKAVSSPLSTTESGDFSAALQKATAATEHDSISDAGSSKNSKPTVTPAEEANSKKSDASVLKGADAGLATVQKTVANQSATSTEVDGFSTSLEQASAAKEHVATLEPELTNTSKVAVTLPNELNSQAQGASLPTELTPAEDARPKWVDSQLPANTEEHLVAKEHVDTPEPELTNTSKVAVTLPSEPNSQAHDASLPTKLTPAEDATPKWVNSQSPASTEEHLVAKEHVDTLEPELANTSEVAVTLPNEPNSQAQGASLPTELTPAEDATPKWVNSQSPASTEERSVAKEHVDTLEPELTNTSKVAVTLPSEPNSQAQGASLPTESAPADDARPKWVNSQLATNTERDNFSDALDKVRDVPEHDNVALTEPTKTTLTDVLLEPSLVPAASTLSADDFKADIGKSLNKFEIEHSDSVNQVLAQINLANSYSPISNVEANIAADGESLPPVDTAAESTQRAQLTGEISDEIVQALSLQSGVAEQNLRDMPSNELNALLKQSNILNAEGELLNQYTALSTQSGTATLAMGSVKSSPTTVANEPLVASRSPLPAMDKAPQLESAINTQQANLTAQTNSAEQTEDAVFDPLAVPSAKAANRDILGKESAIVTSGAVGVSQQAAETMTKTDAEMTASTKAAIVNANSSVNSAALSTESLKEAELSVRLTPIQMGLEANLASGSETSPAHDIKTVTGLQAHNLQVQQSLTRVEPQQIQLSLKQHADQATQMQEMIQRFSPVMKQQLITMVSQGVQQAEIRLDPAELGSMMVRIQVQGDTTQVQFQVSQHQTRDLVEQAMPRLREMLAEQGMELTDGQVSQDSRGGEQGFQGKGSAQGQNNTLVDDFSAEELVASANVSTSSASGIDYYA
ncbi:flagellar hook-length control protein FliK [Shewanella youngdeokensis]|uniref:Flagellar hook-length control protein FliK n=1 Tax=Shewanella youngdeokensis TaxID=2999068 RepID=A0ABZ0K382_9GAMM|nr:flagellar hook-length control protein FliK [Shewanella sp. DAU334]